MGFCVYEFCFVFNCLGREFFGRGCCGVGDWEVSWVGVTIFVYVLTNKVCLKIRGRT